MDIAKIDELEARVREARRITGVLQCLGKFECATTEVSMRLRWASGQGDENFIAPDELQSIQDALRPILAAKLEDL